MKFLIQTIDGKVKHDFSFTLLESIEFQNWLHNDNSMEAIFTDKDTMPYYVPIGSVEFVCEYLRDYYGLVPKPINVPEELFSFANRHIFNGTEKDLKGHGKSFVKSNDGIKQFTDIVDDNFNLPKGNYQISEYIDIDSEWRAFVYKGELVGLQNYGGEFDIFPDVNKIKSMIKAYTRQPVSFTLDVGISGGDTVIIEVHDFFSCGLYGFADHRILPFMFSRWFYSFVKNLEL